MCSLKSHFRADALTTLEAMLKQTKEARGVRRAQAVHEVIVCGRKQGGKVAFCTPINPYATRAGSRSAAVGLTA
jgi:hypothetical protein